MDIKKVNTLFNYIGGKGWLREELRKEMGTMLATHKLTTYVEPFAGGLGAFLGVHDLLKSNGIKKVILNDINSHLINFYKVIATHPEEIVQSYMVLEEGFKRTIPAEALMLHKTKDKLKLKTYLSESEAYYKNIRSEFNMVVADSSNLNITAAAYLLFLQNHCFNGVYRENSKGGYNTPFNWEAKVFSESRLVEKVLAVHAVFNQFETEFTNQSFAALDYNTNTLYYLDPPYLNQNSLVENKYNKDSFTFVTQQELINKISGTNFLYSNHNDPLLLEEFSKICPHIIVREIPRKNIISASIESRKTDKIEILVKQIL